MRRTLHIGLSLVAVSVLMLATAGTSSAQAAGAHAMGVKGAHAAHHRGSTLLSSHGGAIETTPVVFITYWGASWSTGFSTGGYTSAQAQNYVQSFFTNVGGSSWANSTTQYCQNVASGTTNCASVSGAVNVTNPRGQLAGTWNDTSPVPSRLGTSSIAGEALRAVAHFGYNANADYMVFTPTGQSTSGFGTQFCAWHSSTSSSSGPVSFSNMPYQPDAGASCGMNFVNTANNSFGNGYFDGFSIVGGHEYAETVTDPFPSSGWLDGSGAENGDKCAWIGSGQGAAANISLGSNSFAVQSLWSNAFNSGAGGCVLAY
ncbi:MAG TPA: hypothetical protein VKF16_10500 [Candidatus Dormibacteraeota bacterium]|nr:hypothetical protein [Candidatus Dormibacteraeota bacterium]